VGRRDLALSHPHRDRGVRGEKPIAPDQATAISYRFGELAVLLEVPLRVGLRHLFHHFLGADQAQKLHDFSLMTMSASEMRDRESLHVTRTIPSSDAPRCSPRALEQSS